MPRLPFAGLAIVAVMAAACVSFTEAQRSSVESSDQWLRALDSGDADTLWENTSVFMQSRYTKEDLTKRWIGAREPFGALVRREAVLNWAHSYVYGAPDGDYREVGYSSEFEGTSVAIDESVFLSRENGAWKVFRYDIDTRRPR